jgi:hypothetical protein
MLQSNRMRCLLQKRWLCFNPSRNDSRGPLTPTLSPSGEGETVCLLPIAFPWKRDRFEWQTRQGAFAWEKDRMRGCLK